jgi:hypothetical protein
MKTIKVRVVDATTLELLEPAAPGDRVSLKNLHDVELDTRALQQLMQQVQATALKQAVADQTKLLAQDQALRLAQLKATLKEEAIAATTALKEANIKLQAELQLLAQTQKSAVEAERNKLALAHQQQQALLLQEIHAKDQQNCKC